MKKFFAKSLTYVKKNKWIWVYILILLVILPLTIFIARQQYNSQTRAAEPLAIDVQVGRNQSTISNKIVSPSVTTTTGNQLVVVFLTSDGPRNAPQTFNSVTGGGLSFSLAGRANTQRGTAEVWYSYSPNKLSNVQITATRSVGTYRGMMRVVTFKGARSALGSVVSQSGPTGIPNVSLTTTAAGSMVLGVANDPTRAIKHTVGTNQIMTQQFVASKSNTTFWTQQYRGTIPTKGTLITLNSPQPTTDAWNMVGVEVLQTEEVITPSPTGNPSQTYSLWDTNTIPATPSDSDGQAVELGVKFKTDVAGKILGIRYYKSSQNTGTHIGNLWNSSGQLLATATFSNETETGWQEVRFSQPVMIDANTVYIASYHTSTGHYAGDNNYFATTGVDNGPLHALANEVAGGNGVYRYGATSQFPLSSYQATNYWVDVLFQTQDGTVPPTTSPSAMPTSTPSATPILSATPTPTPGSGGCTTYTPTTTFSQCGFPDASNTGAAGSVQQKPQEVTGPAGMVITTDGTVVEGRHIRGWIDVRANNVTIQNNYIVGTSWFGIKLASGKTGLRVLRNTIVGAPENGTQTDYGVNQLGAGGTMEVGWNNISRYKDGVVANSAYIHDNYIHTTRYYTQPTLSHNQAIFIWDGGTGVTVTHNTLLNQLGSTNEAEKCCSTAALYIDEGTQRNHLIQNNWMAGGASVMYVGGPGSSNIRVLDNVFSTEFFSGGGFYGDVAKWDPNGSGNVWSNNVWGNGANAGQPVTP